MNKKLGGRKFLDINQMKLIVEQCIEFKTTILKNKSISEIKTIVLINLDPFLVKDFI